VADLDPPLYTLPSLLTDTAQLQYPCIAMRRLHQHTAGLYATDCELEAGSYTPACWSLASIGIWQKQTARDTGATNTTPTWSICDY
jgi:hypothetical protein